MLKRIPIALFALVYLAISSGIVVNTHYCMGRMSSVKLQAWSPAKCGCGKETGTKKGCCKTELKVVKVEDAQKASYADHSFQTPVTAVVTPLNLLQAPFHSTALATVAQAHAPPLLSGQDTYLRNCVFRI